MKNKEEDVQPSHENDEDVRDRGATLRLGGGGGAWLNIGGAQYTFSY